MFVGVKDGVILGVGVSVGVCVVEFDGVGGIVQSTQFKSKRKYLSFNNLKLC